MTKTYHLGQSITGPLRSWNRRDWKNATKWITKDDGSHFTADELKDAFLSQLAAGHEVIPIGSPCDNWDWKHGCGGHPQNDSEDQTQPKTQ